MIPNLTPKQRRVFSAICLYPGIHASRIPETAGEVGPSFTHQTLIRLERLGLIRTRLITVPPRKGVRRNTTTRRVCVPAPWVLA